MRRANSILIRCDAWPEMGFGHVVRCLALADELRDEQGCRVAFAMREETAGSAMVQERGYQVMSAGEEILKRDYAGWLERCIDEVRASSLVLDVRDDLPMQSLQSLRRRGVLIATIDDPSSRRLAADLAFYPPVPQLRQMDWTGFAGEIYAGWEYVLLRREFSHPIKRESHEPPVVLVTMGGSDPFGLTLKAVSALDALEDDFRSRVMLGPGFLHDRALKDLLAGAHRRFELLRNPEDVPGLMADSDLALASFGVTAYELAAMGVPGIHLCLTEDHARSASAFVEAGMAESLGRHDRVSVPMLAHAAQGLIRDGRRRESMSNAGMRKVDGKGAARVAGIIAGRIASGD